MPILDFDALFWQYNRRNYLPSGLIVHEDNAGPTTTRVCEVSQGRFSINLQPHLDPLDPSHVHELADCLKAEYFERLEER